MKNRFLISIFIVFFFSLLIRLTTLNEMGRTWDEDPYVEQGYEYVSLINRGDFKNPYWYETPDHPLLARYFYGFATQFQVKKINGVTTFPYDYTLARIVSIIICSLTIILVMLIGKKYFSDFVAIFSGIILALLPLSIGYSEIASLESFILFFFTLSVFTFLHLLENPSIKNQILSGITLGMALMVKQSNILLIPLLFLIQIIYNFRLKKSKISYWYLINILGIGFITFFLLWPMPWYNLDFVIKYHNTMWLPQKPLPPPELIFGKFMLTPIFYYVLSILITTPSIILLLAITGGLTTLKENKTYGIIILIWFLFPFIQSFYHFRQHNIRYIIEIYAPFSIVAALGFEYILQKFTKNTTQKIIASSLLIIYLLITTIKASPYYLDYFNVLVGGTKNVYNNKLFLLGWWGQGMKEAGEYLEKNTPKGSRIGVAISPYKAFPPLPDQKVEKYDKRKKYDYVVVSYFNVLREGFDDTQIRKNYKLIYSVNADGAKLVNIYKNK